MEASVVIDRLKKIEEEFKLLNFYMTPPQSFTSLDDLGCRLKQIEETANTCTRLLPACDDKTVRDTITTVRFYLYQCAVAARKNTSKVDVTAPIHAANCSYKFLLKVWRPYNRATGLVALIKELLESKVQIEELKQLKK